MAITPQQWLKNGNYFTYRGHKIFYQTGGSGEPLVLIHGFPTSSWDWEAIWQTLTARYYVIAPDMIGFGYSDKPTNYEYRIHDQADLHLALLETLGVREFHIFAHDYGDTVAQEMLARHNEESHKEQPRFAIKSVCFLNGGIFPEMHRARPIQKLLLRPVIGWLICRLFTKKRFDAGLSEVFGVKPSAQELQDFWDILKYKNGQYIGYKLIHYITDRRQHRDRWVNALKEARIPLRLINGPVDPVSGRHAADKYAVEVPNADVVILEGIGHYPHVEAPREVEAAYLEFRSAISQA